MENNSCPHCGERHKERTQEEKKELLIRLRRAEGQIRGIEKMVEENAYCPDILIQVSAVNQALNSFNKVLPAISKVVCQKISEPEKKKRSMNWSQFCKN